MVIDANALLAKRLPPPKDIALRIESCREELTQLRKLLRASVAAHEADEARRRRRQAPLPKKEGRP